MDHTKQPKAYVSPALLSVPSTSSSARSHAWPAERVCAVLVH